MDSKKFKKISIRYKIIEKYGGNAEEYEAVQSKFMCLDRMLNQKVYNRAYLYLWWIS